LGKSRSREGRMEKKRAKGALTLWAKVEEKGICLEKEVV
jgi:hypothetical protein